jgi:hypothetical protein
MSPTSSYPTGSQILTLSVSPTSPGMWPVSDGWRYLEYLAHAVFLFLFFLTQLYCFPLLISLLPMFNNLHRTTPSSLLRERKNKLLLIRLNSGPPPPTGRGTYVGHQAYNTNTRFRNSPMGLGKQKVLYPSAATITIGDFATDWLAGPASNENDSLLARSSEYCTRECEAVCAPEYCEYLTYVHRVCVYSSYSTLTLQQSTRSVLAGI